MLDVLRKVAAFQSLPPAALERLLEWGKPRVFSAGEVLLRQGDPSTSLHVVVRGRVRIERVHPRLPDPIVLADLGPGELVGEMGVLDGEPRSATVTALEDTRTLELGATVLAQTVLLYPEVSQALLRTLSARLRNANDLVEHMLLNRQGS